MKEIGVDMRPRISRWTIPKVYEMISAGDTDGVFQLEGGGMRTFLQSMKPEIL